MKKLGFVRVGAAVPLLKVASPSYNTAEIQKQIKEAETKKVDIITFPELCISGSTCADLFYQNGLLEKCLENLKKIVEMTQRMHVIVLVGFPLKVENTLLNVAAIIQKGKIHGIVPKSFLPNFGESYEKRWFTSGRKIKKETISLFGEEIPFGTDILFRDKENPLFCFGVEICEDLWSINPPSNQYALHGATLLFNLSANSEITSRKEYRTNLVKMHSTKTISAYIYASAGAFESTTDLVFSGHSMICENGKVVEEGKLFSLTNEMIVADVDLLKLSNMRMRTTEYMETEKTFFRTVEVDIGQKGIVCNRLYPKYPFVPEAENDRMERCKEIFRIQVMGLVKRLHHIGTEKTIIGMSGGLDSTLAFLVMVEAYKILEIEPTNIIAITMPGFGTTGRTYNNAVALVHEYGATLRDISIKESTRQHFKDIGHDEKVKNITYENAQARERTQILMDVANQENGIVIGTGDLSELLWVGALIMEIK